MSKKLQSIIIFAIIFFGINNIFAQTFELSSKSDVEINMKPDALDKAYGYVLNKTDSPIKINIVISHHNANTNKFIQVCSGESCYIPTNTTFLIKDYEIQPNNDDSENTFGIQLIGDEDNLNMGVSKFDISISNVADENDKIEYTITFNISKDGSVQYWKNTSSTFPNPANDFVNIKLNNSLENNIIKIFDNTGNQVYSSNFNGDSHNINTTNLSNGAYRFSIENKGNIINSGNFIIQK